MRPARVAPAARTRARIVLLLLALGAVYLLLTSSRSTRGHASGRGSGSRRLGPREEEDTAPVVRPTLRSRDAVGPVDESATLQSPPPSPPPAPPPLLSRSTALWEKLLEEGLHHPSSGYPQVQPRNPAVQEEWEFWQDRVMHEYPNGASADTSPSVVRVLSWIAHGEGADRVLRPPLSRLSPRLWGELHEEAVSAEAYYYWPVQSWHHRAV